MVAAWALLSQKLGWVVVLAFYPPYHSKYNPIERLWGILENYWRGELLDSEEAVLGYAGHMTYNQVHPRIYRVTKEYAKGVKRTKAQKKRLEQHLKRKPGIEKWAIENAPLPPDLLITLGCLRREPSARAGAKALAGGSRLRQTRENGWSSGRGAGFQPAREQQPLG